MLVDTQKQTCQNPTELEVFCVGLPSPPLPPPRTATSHGGLRNFGYLANTEYPPPKKNQNLTFFPLVHFLTSPRIPLVTPPHTSHGCGGLVCGDYQCMLRAYCPGQA